MTMDLEGKPSLMGYRMPAEWEPHQPCWMGWPERPDNWRKNVHFGQHAFVEVASAISQFEPVTICVSSGQFVVHDRESRSSCEAHQVAGIDWNFNSWGDDGTFAMKKVPIQSEEKLTLVREEIHVSSLFSHPNLLPLLDHAIIAVKGNQQGSWKHEAYLLFPVHLDGTLLDVAKTMQTKKEFYPTLTVLQIFWQLCAGLKHKHSFDPPYAHNDVKPGNVLITHRKGQPPIAILMDFGSARPFHFPFTGFTIAV